MADTIWWHHHFVLDFFESIMYLLKEEMDATNGFKLGVHRLQIEIMYTNS